jgi:pimeloyl-ACP methyl ester carboxylesterase
MDRRGRRSSGDSDRYALGSEYGDVAAVAAALASEQGGPVDVLGHSFGGTRVLGAAAFGAPFRRIVLYEPLLLGMLSPPWAGQITRKLAPALVAPTVTELAAVGHEALDAAPDMVVAEVLGFLGGATVPPSDH